jgi:hypothetical protein
MASTVFSCRALRRHHRERLKKARTAYWGGPHLEWGETCEARRLGLLVKTPSPCSCCPFHLSERKAHGNGARALTFQEHRAHLREKEGKAEAMAVCDD